MERTRLNFPHISVEVATVDNIIYVRLSGTYTDEVALALIRHVEPIIEQIPANPVRVWDARGVPAGEFKLTSQCVDVIAKWAQEIKSKKPGSVAYLISPTEISFGMSRMYGIKSGLESTGIVALKDVHELPEAIRNRLPL